MALLAVALLLYAASLVLLILDVWRAPGLPTSARLAWTAAFLIASFFVVVLWFAQRKTGPAGRAGSMALVAAIAVSIAVIVIEALKVV